MTTTTMTRAARRLALLLSLPAAALLVACSGPGSLTDAGKNELERAGSFSATVSGNVSWQLHGGAVYGYYSDEDGSQAGLHLISDSASGYVHLIFARNGAQLQPGKLAITESGELQGAMTDSDLGPLRIFWFDSGTLTVTSRNDRAISGTFTATGYQASPELVEGNRVTVTGSFSAVVAPVGSLGPQLSVRR